MFHITDRLRAALCDVSRWSEQDQNELAARIRHEIRQREAEETGDVIDELTAYQPAHQVG